MTSFFNRSRASLSTPWPFAVTLLIQALPEREVPWKVARAQSVQRAQVPGSTAGRTASPVLRAFPTAFSGRRFPLRACLKIPRGAVLAENAAWRGATREHTRQGSVTEEQRSQTAFSAKTLRAAGLLSGLGIGSATTVCCGDALASPHWPQPKFLAAVPRAIHKQALRHLGLASPGCSLNVGKPWFD